MGAQVDCVLARAEPRLGQSPLGFTQACGEVSLVVIVNQDGGRGSAACIYRQAGNDEPPRAGSIGGLEPLHEFTILEVCRKDHAKPWFTCRRVSRARQLLRSTGRATVRDRRNDVANWSADPYSVDRS